MATGTGADAEEDGHAASSAAEVARGLRENTLPPFIGIRIKPLNEDLRVRSMRTLDIFVTALARRDTAGKLPENFVITVPKIQLPEHVGAGGAVLRNSREAATDLPAGSLEDRTDDRNAAGHHQRAGEIALGSLVDAAEGRCRSVHFGVYDYTASTGITAAYQTMGHPACDFARQVMLVSLAGTGIHLSDGATNILPVGPHRAARRQTAHRRIKLRENREAVHNAWRLGFDDNMHSLRNGFYQGWDLHPAQFVTRYAAVYSFFLDGLSERFESA